MSSISLRTSIEELTLFTATDDYHLPSPKAFLTPGVQVTSHLRQLYRPREEWALLDAFIKPGVAMKAGDFERRFGEVRELLKRLAKESPEDSELLIKADRILKSNQQALQSLNHYRNALIGA